jgi:putative glutamine amidotransferase
MFHVEHTRFTRSSLFKNAKSNRIALQATNFLFGYPSTLKSLLGPVFTSPKTSTPSKFNIYHPIDMKPRIAIPIPTLSDHDYNQRSWSAYAEAVRQAGGEPVEVPLSTTGLASIMESCHGILLPGSPADVDPEHYGETRIPECADPDQARETVDTLLLEEAYLRRKPLFTICFGTQILNVFRGGTLVQHVSPVPVNHGAGKSVAIAHSISIVPDSLLAEIIQSADPAEASHTQDFVRLPVNSSHHQAIGLAGNGLRITARCPQDEVVEAAEGDDPGHYVMAVQWHPERSTEISATSRALFSRFVEAAANWSPAG